MSAAELRRAAETLRGLAEGATPGEWFKAGSGIGVTVKGCTCAGPAPGYPQHESHCGTDGPIIDGTEPDIAYIATMHPGVGLALADLLARAAFLADEAEHASRVVSDQAMSHIPANYAPIVLDALTLARLINGAQPDGGV